MNKTTLVIKVIISLLIGFLMLVFFRYYSTSLGASFAVNQLEDSYSSSASISIWRDLVAFAPVVYLLIVLLIFFKEIKLLFSFIK